MKANHTHRATRSADYGFSGPVAIHDQNPAAHGNICRVDSCSCGATRRTNINGSHKERGAWEMPKVQAARDERTGAWSNV
jgi:hypothetical protein